MHFSLSFFYLKKSNNDIMITSVLHRGKMVTVCQILKGTCPIIGIMLLVTSEDYSKQNSLCVY